MCDFRWCSMALTLSFCNGILPEWSKGADLRSARRSSAWVQTPQVPCYAPNRRILAACGSESPASHFAPALSCTAHFAHNYIFYLHTFCHPSCTNSSPAVIIVAVGNLKKPLTPTTSILQYPLTSCEFFYPLRNCCHSQRVNMNMTNGRCGRGEWW